MSALSDYIGDAPIGSIIQAPYNLTDPNWLPCLGQKVSRSLYPALSACLPGVGTFTSTTRAHANAGNFYGLCASNSLFVASGDGASAASAIQTSPDGVTWTARTGPTLAQSISIVFDGTNVVANAANKPWYSTDGGINWTACVTATGSLATQSLQCSMTHAPQLGTVGRFAIVTNGAVWTSDDRGVNWVSATVTGAVAGIAWTGTQFIALSTTASKILTSPTGLTGTWTTVNLPVILPACSTSLGGIASNGAGLICISHQSGDSGSIVYSVDNGVNWALRKFGDSAGSFTPYNCVSYANGKFFAHLYSPLGTYSMGVSQDLLSWVIFSEAGMVNAHIGTVAYKAGTYMDIANGAAHSTWVEDMSNMHLPRSPQGAGATGWNNFMPWIKVR